VADAAVLVMHAAELLAPKASRRYSIIAAESSVTIHGVTEWWVGTVCDMGLLCSVVTVVQRRVHAIGTHVIL
jgi:hypothetical protein